MALANATLTTSTAAIFTCANVKGTAVKAITLTNYSGSTVTVSLYACPLAEAAANENLILNGLSIDAGKTYNYKEAELLLSNTDDIKALASANTSVAVTVSYYNI